MKLVLSIDGGGIRGILPARLLQALQESGHFPKFDLIAGTSTGGIIACGLAIGVQAKTMVGIYANNGPQIFDSKFLDGTTSPKYQAAIIEKLLHQALGEWKLSQAPTELLVPAYCIQLPSPQDSDGDGVKEGAASWFFKSWEARANPAFDAYLWQVARATSAAPIYFPTASWQNYWMVDGGIFAGNPADCAWAAASRLWPGETIRILSIGTGSKVKALDGNRSQAWGMLQWLPELPTIFMDGAADKTTYILKTLLQNNLLRCDIALAGVDEAFDNASVGNLAGLEKLADRFVAEQLPKIIQFVS